MPTNDPIKAEQQQGDMHPRSSFDDTADIRDILANMVGGGYRGLYDDNIRADYGRLQVLLGKPEAQKMMQHVFVFNQRPDVQNQPWQQRLKSFYSVGSPDQGISEILNKAKSFGKGPEVGVDESVNQGNVLMRNGQSMATQVMKNAMADQMAAAALKGAK